MHDATRRAVRPSRAYDSQTIAPGSQVDQKPSSLTVEPVQKGYRGSRKQDDELLKGKKVVVVGGGPAGSCAALFMAKLGATVDVYERRSNTDQVAGASSRSYLIILQKRGLQAMERAGAGVTVDDSNRYLGSVNISNRGRQRASKSAGSSASFTRADLALHLMNRATSVYPAAVTFHLGWQCMGGDLDGRLITFKNVESGASRAVVYDFLIGADGQSSRVRDLFEDQIDGFVADVREGDREYKPFSGLASDSLEPPEWRDAQSGRSLFMWTSKRPGYTLTANRRSDGVFAGNFGSTHSNFAALHTEEDNVKVLQSAFPDLPDGWATEIAQQVAQKEASKLPKTIKCTQLHGPSAVLIGDAAHTVTPILGQGANAALEDTQLLYDAVLQSRGDLEAAANRFNKLRLRDAQSLVDINRYVELATRLGPFAVLLFIPGIIHIALGTVLSKLLPFIFLPPPITKLDEGASYRAVVNGVFRDCALFVIIIGVAAIFITQRMPLAR